MKPFIDKLEQNKILSKEEFITLLKSFTPEDAAYLFKKARRISKQVFGNKIYTRGLIEFTNYCKNNCYYCGIRQNNHAVDRYRLTDKEIMECCRTGYHLGFRTFVLQGGEDPYFTDTRIVALLRQIKAAYSTCAITLSIGERPSASYQAFFDAGTDRFLLRHETADNNHYRFLHPERMTLESRMNCLWALKEIGFQTGTGFMVGSPGQTPELLAKDLLFIHELNPQMVGIGPYLSHHQTPFAKKENGSMELTLFLIGVLRLMLPHAMLPATTALGTIHPKGREKGILAGANVVMPNLSPASKRKQYELYDNKLCTGGEAAEYRMHLHDRMTAIGYELSSSRGDYF